MVKYLRQNQNYTFTRMSNKIFLINTFCMTLVLVYNLMALTGPKLNLMSSQSRSLIALLVISLQVAKSQLMHIMSRTCQFSSHTTSHASRDLCSFIVALDIRGEFFGR